MSSTAFKIVARWSLLVGVSDCKIDVAWLMALVNICQAWLVDSKVGGNLQDKRMAREFKSFETEECIAAKMQRPDDDTASLRREIGAKHCILPANDQRQG